MLFHGLIRNGFLEKCMADEGFGIYVFSLGKRDSFWGFCARLFGVLPGYARGIFSSIEK